MIQTLCSCVAELQDCTKMRVIEYLCFRGRQRLKKVFKRKLFVRSDVTKMSELESDEVAGVIINQLCRLKNHQYFYMQVRIDSGIEGKRYYVGL